jgi:hypothetical protein
LLLTFALAATLLVLLFARDVTRSAHGAIGPRRSENRSFAQLANLLITQENEFDSHLAYLLANGQTLTRPVFAARLGQLNQLLPTWVSEADQLRRPKLAHAINDAVVLLTEQRVDAYQSLFANVARALSLPWPAISATSKSVRDPARTLLDTSHEWNFDRWGLALEPGRATLLALTSTSATFDAANGRSTLLAAPSLAPTRGIGIAAVEVAPSSLPASAGTLVLPPVTSIHLVVSVTNAGYVTQPVTLRVTLQPAHGSAQRQTMSTTLGPLQSYAFVANPFTTVPSEHATLTLSLVGAPAASGMTRSRTYQVTMSPSGNR